MLRQHLLALLKCRAEPPLVLRTVFTASALLRFDRLSRGSGLEHSPSAAQCQKQNGTLRGGLVVRFLAVYLSTGTVQPPLGSRYTLLATGPLYGLGWVATRCPHRQDPQIHVRFRQWLEGGASNKLRSGGAPHRRGRARTTPCPERRGALLHHADPMEKAEKAEKGHGEKLSRSQEALIVRCSRLQLADERIHRHWGGDRLAPAQRRDFRPRPGRPSAVVQHAVAQVQRATGKPSRPCWRYAGRQGPGQCTGLVRRRRSSRRPSKP